MNRVVPTPPRTPVPPRPPVPDDFAVRQRQERERMLALGQGGSLSNILTDLRPRQAQGNRKVLLGQ